MPIERLIPDFKNVVDPKVELKLNQAFQRLYEYIDIRVEEAKKEIISKMEELKISQEDISGLIGIFSQPLAGSDVSDPLLESLTKNFGPQPSNFILAGPTPSFRALSSSDIPSLSAAKITTGIFPLARIDGDVLKTDDNLTKTLGAPVADGTITIKDNTGNSVKVMTTP